MNTTSDIMSRHEWALANARLIAAAPDLLATLRTILAVSERRAAPAFIVISDAARTAIAKATGAA